MRTSGLGLISILVACSSAPQAAPPPPPRPSATQPPASPQEGVEIHPDAGGLRVGYRSLRPAQTFRFGGDGAPIRKETWKVLGAGLSFTEGNIAAEVPVRSFEIAIAPDAAQHDRVYPALTRIGDGWLIYAPHLWIEGADVPRHLAIDLPPGWTVAGRRRAAGELAGDGYVFVGPSSYVHRGGADVVTAPSTPGWLLEEIEASAGKTMAFYERRLGVALGDRATIVVTHEPDKNGSFHGDTTPGAMMSLRLYGPTWKERDGGSVEVLADFVDHELFHFWNGEIARPAQGSARPWLHEGGANYAALLAARDRGTMSDEAFAATIDRHLERCQAALGNRDLRTQGPKRGRDTYACGTVLQWALDLGLRHASNGERDVLSWWKDVLAQARRDGGTYTLESAHALVGADASRAADLLLDAGDERRWAAFAEAARRYGAPMTQRRLASRDLASALDHVLAIHCGRDRGFFTFPTHVKLDTGTRCGPLAGDLEVDAVAGFHPVDQASAMYDEVRRRCAAKKPISFGWRGKIVAQAPCTTPLPEATLGWQIQRPGETPARK